MISKIADWSLGLGVMIGDNLVDNDYAKFSTSMCFVSNADISWPGSVLVAILYKHTTIHRQIGIGISFSGFFSQSPNSKYLSRAEKGFEMQRFQVEQASSNQHPASQQDEEGTEKLMKNKVKDAE